MSKYRKAMIAASGVCATLGTVLADGHVDGSEGVAVVLAALAAFGVYRVPNKL